MNRILWAFGLFTCAFSMTLLSAGFGSFRASSIARPEKTGISLNIGLNSVDPGHYGGWAGTLNACENDANDMADIAKNQGFTVTKLLTKGATRKAVIDNVTAAARQLKDGDTFFLSYSGHGGQIPDTNGDEPDGLDETMCFYDGEFIDDELAALWPNFAKGVRIFVLSDSCHSGTVTRLAQYASYSRQANVNAPDAQFFSTRFENLLGEFPRSIERPLSSPVRAMPFSIVNTTYRNNKAFYDGISNGLAKERDSARLTKCSVLLISGCQDNQLSYDGPINGYFTGKLKLVWNAGAFRGDYRDFHARIMDEMPSTQSPNYFFFGTSNIDFESEKPFTR